jgi:hypothetical protein
VNPLYDYLYGSNMFGLAAMLAQDMSANDYFASLTPEVQQEINEHEDEIHSVEDMKRFVARLRLTD